MHSSGHGYTQRLQYMHSDISIVNKDCVVGVLHCMSALMSNYPGACGAAPSNTKAIDVMLVRNMTTNDVILAKQVIYFAIVLT